MLCELQEMCDDPQATMEGSNDTSSDPASTDMVIPAVDEHDVFNTDKISLVSVMYIGSEVWVTDFDKMELSKSIMERLSSIEGAVLTEPTLDAICAGKDPTDGQWYRVQVIALQPAIMVHFIDFGNETQLPIHNLAVLPDELKLDPPLAKKATLKWENPPSPEVFPSVGDVLEVKYNGKEADGTLKLEVLAIKGISDPDEALSDDERPDVLESENAETADNDDVERQEAEAAEAAVPIEVQAASSLREEAHSTVQEILKKLDEELPNQDQTRREVEKTLKEIDANVPLQQEVALQVQKMMEELDGRLQKQQEVALSSMRQMMEKALSQSLYKIDRIQKDLHKLYANSKQQMRNSGGGPGGDDLVGGVGAGVGTGTGAGAGYQRNQYSRPNPMQLQAAPAHAHEYLDKAGRHHNPKYGHFSDGMTTRSPHANVAFPKEYANYRPGKREQGNANTNSPSRSAVFGQTFVEEQNDNSRRSVSLRLKQARNFEDGGDSNCNPIPNPPYSTILSVNNLPETFTCDYLCTLFGLYGNVSRAKMLFNQKGKALVEMADGAQVAAAAKILDGTFLFGQMIHVRPCTFDKLNISPTELTNKTAKDNTVLNSYQANAVRRFKKGYWDASRLVAPSETLRVSNILCVLL